MSRKVPKRAGRQMKSGLSFDAMSNRANGIIPSHRISSEIGAEARRTGVDRLSVRCHVLSTLYLLVFSAGTIEPHTLDEVDYVSYWCCYLINYHRGRHH